SGDVVDDLPLRRHSAAAGHRQRRYRPISFGTNWCHGRHLPARLVERCGPLSEAGNHHSVGTRHPRPALLSLSVQRSLHVGPVEYHARFLAAIIIAGHRRPEDRHYVLSLVIRRSPPVTGSRLTSFPNTP